MKDFRRQANKQTIEQQRSGLIKRLFLIQAAGAPLFLGAAFSAMAYFQGTVILPFLEDRQTALTILAACAAGLAIEGLLTFKTIRDLNATKVEQ